MVQLSSFSTCRKFLWVARKQISLNEVTFSLLRIFRASRIVSLVRRDMELWTSSQRWFLSTSRSLLALNARKYPSGVYKQMDEVKVMKSRDSRSSNFRIVSSSYLGASRSGTQRIGWCPVAVTLPSCWFMLRYFPVLTLLNTTLAPQRK